MKTNNKKENNKMRKSFIVFIIALSFFICITAKANKERDYSLHEKDCLSNGWKKITINVSGIKRQLLWKEPAGKWKNGAIILLHGGGGNYTNWGSKLRICEPMSKFSDLAVKNGFALFALDSAYNLVTDKTGKPAGKRFDCLYSENKPNLDLYFIKEVIVNIIPKLRPAYSAENIFMTGISNGGFMTILASTKFDDKITSFVPVSAGDPYGTSLTCTNYITLRKNAPGFYFDNETHKNVLKNNSCKAIKYPHEKQWYTANPVKKPSFKQFHNAGDRLIDISCMKKAEYFLNLHGYKNDGSYILQDKGGKSTLKHLWSKKYNQPIIDFFIKSRSL